MNPIIVPVLTLLAGLGMRGIAIAELFVRLRWQERQRYAQRSALMVLTCTLQRGFQLHKTRPDGSELHLMFAGRTSPADRATDMTRPAPPGRADTPRPRCPRCPPAGEQW